MKICFFGSGIYDSLIGNPPGGSELQVALLADSLANNGHDVYVIENLKSNASTIINNIKIRFTASSNVKVIRFIFQKLPNMIKYLIRIKPDYIYIRGIHQWDLIPLIFSKVSDKTKIILAIPSDIDTLSYCKRYKYVFSVKTSLFNWLINDLPSSLVFPILIRFSDILLCQHYGQYVSLSKQKNKLFIFPNIYNKPIAMAENVRERDCFIYVGSINERKGLSSLKYLIHALPNTNFKIIGQAQGEKSQDELTKLKSLKNVIYAGQLKNDLVLEQIATAKALINVSRYEGFSNTFLESWASGIPVISLFANPGNVINENELGYFANGNIDKMKVILENFVNRFSTIKLQEYVVQNHSHVTSAKRFVKILDQAKGV